MIIIKIHVIYVEFYETFYGIRSFFSFIAAIFVVGGFALGDA